MDLVRWDLCDVMRCGIRNYSCWDCIAGGNCFNGIFIARISKFWKDVTLRAFYSWWTNRTTGIWQWWYTLTEKEHYIKSYSDSTLILRKLCTVQQNYIQCDYCSLPWLENIRVRVFTWQKATDPSKDINVLNVWHFNLHWIWRVINIEVISETN